MWRRSTVCRDQLSRPHFVFSPRDDIVAAWNFLDGGFGLHILDVDTGKTTNTFLKERSDIPHSKFVDDKCLLACYVQDTFYRLLNVRSRKLLSMLDLGERPVCLGASVESFLVAVGLKNRMKFLHVWLPKMKEETKKKGENLVG